MEVSRSTDVFDHDSVDIEFVGEEELGPEFRPHLKFLMRRYLYRWRPPARLAQLLHANATIEFDVFLGGDGIRRFRPAGGFKPYIHAAREAGLGLLIQQRTLPSHEQIASLAQFAIYNWCVGSKEYFTRQFTVPKDLQVLPGSREDLQNGALLSQYLGPTAGNTPPFTVDCLHSLARERLLPDGIDERVGKVIIPYGIVEWARHNAFKVIPSDDFRSAIRWALFDVVEDGDKASAELTADVWKRLTDKVTKVRKRSRGAWQKWLQQPHDNLVKSLARLTRYPSGKLHHCDVRRALVELGWQSVICVAECLSTFAESFCLALPEQLNSTEQRMFQLMYGAEPCFGGLPLMLLMQHKKLLQPLMGELMLMPDDPHMIGAVQRLLMLYAEMAPARRAADRRGKSRCHEVSIPDVGGRKAAKSAASEARNVVTELLRRVVEQRQLRCPECGQALDYDWDRESVKPGSPLQVVLRCDRHGGLTHLAIPWAELTATAKRLEES